MVHMNFVSISSSPTNSLLLINMDGFSILSIKLQPPWGRQITLRLEITKVTPTCVSLTAFPPKFQAKSELSEISKTSSHRIHVPNCNQNSSRTCWWDISHPPFKCPQSSAISPPLALANLFSCKSKKSVFVFFTSCFNCRALSFNLKPPTFQLTIIYIKPAQLALWERHVAPPRLMRS